MHAHVLREAFATSHTTQHKTLVRIYLARKSQLAAILQQERKNSNKPAEGTDTLQFIQWGYNTTSAESKSCKWKATFWI